jgi:hypothetical protein
MLRRARHERASHVLLKLLGSTAGQGNSRPGAPPAGALALSPGTAGPPPAAQRRHAPASKQGAVTAGARPRLRGRGRGRGGRGPNAERVVEGEISEHSVILHSPERASTIVRTGKNELSLLTAWSVDPPDGDARTCVGILAQESRVSHSRAHCPEPCQVTRHATCSGA